MQIEPNAAELSVSDDAFLIAPYGGDTLVDLLVPPDEVDEVKRYAWTLPSIQLSARSTCDLELLGNGACSPLDRFMNRADYESVLAEMRLADGRLFPIPVTLPVADDAPVSLDTDVALRSPTNDLLAVLTIEEIYRRDGAEESIRVCGTRDEAHPFVAEMSGWGKRYVSGRLRVLNLPAHRDFRDLRLTPAQTRVRLRDLGHRNVVAFQTRNPLHRAHEEMTKLACERIDGALLLHPAVGVVKPGDVDYITRVRTYRALIESYYDEHRTLLALLPVAMRMSGAREAVWHAIIRRNYGANHLIVGRDHASPGKDSNGQPFYEPYAAQELVAETSAETGVAPVCFEEMAYLAEEDRYEEISRAQARGAAYKTLSGSEARESFLNAGRLLPAWYTRPEVAEILAEAYPAKHKQGVCVWLTGLSGAGKSSIAEALTPLLIERGRRVTLLDGDVVRTHLSKGLGFSRADRDANVLRIGFVAAEIVRHGGVAVCAAVSPYRETRADVRRMFASDGFIEIFVDTKIEVCEARDTKGLYAKARCGELKNFTGIDDPYQSPQHAELTVDGGASTPEMHAAKILQLLSQLGYVRG